MKKVRILTVQYKIRYLDIQANLEKFDRIIRKYKFMKPDLVIFPEYALSGPLYSHYDLIKTQDLFIEKLNLIAKKHKVNLIPGSFIRKVNDKMYNSSCLLSKEGKLIAYYDKQILWSSEKKYLSPGKNTAIINSSIGKIGLQICADLQSPLISEKMRREKPDLIVNLAMWSKEDKKVCTKLVPNNIESLQTEYLCRARAIENKCYMIFCNFADSLTILAKTGRSYKETSIGNSLVINPYGEIIARTHTNRAEVLFTEIDISKCHWSPTF